MYDQKSKGFFAGIPDDEAVGNVGGRPGAAGGPRTFREAFNKMKGRTIIPSLIDDVGNIQLGEGDLEEKHEIAGYFLKQQFPFYEFSIIIGGSHDYAYPHLLGLNAAWPDKTIGCINIDPHLDIRKPDPYITSGSGFYLSLENKILKPETFVEFGTQPHSNNPDLFHQASSRELQVVPFSRIMRKGVKKSFKDALEKISSAADIIMVSLDLDSIQAAFAPGVSAPAAEGFTPSEMLRIIKTAASHPKVISLGIYELNPIYDVDHQTARLAATLAWYFAEGKFNSLDESISDDNDSH